MLGPSYALVEVTRFFYEVQSVALMRLARLARGGPRANREARRMIAEKFDALIEAERAIAESLARGEFLIVTAERAYAPVRRRVHANSRRLTH